MFPTTASTKSRITRRYCYWPRRGASHLSTTWRVGGWDISDRLPDVRRIRGRRLGVVGLGASAAKCRSGLRLGCACIDPNVNARATRAAGATPVDLGNLLELVRRHYAYCPLVPRDPSSHQRRDSDSRERWAILINTSRGGLVDPHALNWQSSRGELALRH